MVICFCRNDNHVASIPRIVIDNNDIERGIPITCQCDAFQLDAVNFGRANETRFSWTRPNETLPK